MISLPARRALFAAVFYGNLLSLGCQVLWVRKLNTLFGSTAAVFGAVLAVFLTGLALGALWGGRAVSASAKPWRLLAACLAAVSVWCAISIPLFDGARRAYLALVPPGLAPAPAAWSKLPVVIALILPPTLAIGAFLPIAAAIASREISQVGRRVAALYAADTLGAGAGALLAGFVFVPTMGLRLSTAILGVVGVALAWTLDRRGPAWELLPAPTSSRRQRKAARAARASDPDPLSARSRFWVGISFALSGFAAMLLETGWNRFFYVLNGTSVFSLSLVLAGFLAGIGTGSLLAGRRIDRIRHLPSAVALLQVCIALAGVLVLRARVPFEKSYLGIFRASDSFAGFQTGVALLVFGLVFVATLAMGANFPLVARLVLSSAERTGPSVGTIYAINTAGAVCGALLSEFLILPAWGFGGLMTASTLAYCASALIFLAIAPATRIRRWATAGAAAGALLLVPPVLAFQPPPNALYYHGLRDRTWENFSQVNRESTPIFVRQGFYGQVSVLAAGPGLFLKHNGKTDATNLSGDNFAQYLLGHLPLLLHPDPRRVVNIGLGGGITLGAITRHREVREIVQVEIDPLVAEAARGYFADFNHHAMDDPRVRFVFDDGRNFVERSSERFDVIVSEPPNIWVGGVSGLFTHEFYLAARAHLEPGGLLCQWLPIHELSRDDFRLAMRTITTVFPHAAVWSNGYDGIVLAASDPLPTAGPSLAARLAQPGMDADLREIGLTVDSAPAFLSHPRFDAAYLAALLGAPGRLNTDDLPVLEFRSARNLYEYAKSNWADHWLVHRSN